MVNEPRRPNCEGPVPSHQCRPLRRYALRGQPPASTPGRVTIQSSSQRHSSRNSPQWKGPDSLLARTVAVLWPRFGPYHLARLAAAARLLTQGKCTLVGIEVARKDPTYAWDVAEGADGFDRLTLFPSADYGALSPKDIRQRTREALERMTPAAVAVNGWALPEAGAALRWCGSTGTPAIVMSASNEHDQPRQAAKEWLKGQVVRAYDAALVGGSCQRDYLIKLGMPPSRIFVGYDAVDNAYFQSRTPKTKSEVDATRGLHGLPDAYFLACSRFVPKKNLHTLLKAYAAYRDSASTPWDLVLCGSGELEDELKGLARALNLRGIHWPGFVQYADLPIYYALASAFILPSTTEQWGLVVNEAMATGLPVLVSERAGAGYDLVEEGGNGFLFDPYDVGGVADAMLRMSLLPDAKRQVMGHRSQEIIAQWGPDRFAEGLWSAVQAVPRRVKPRLVSRLALRALTSPLASRFG